MGKMMITTALRRKARVEKKIGELVADLKDARKYYVDEEPVDIQSILNKVGELGNDLTKLSEAIQKANIRTGAIKLIAQRNLMDRIIASLKKDRTEVLPRWSIRSTEDVRLKDNPWYDSLSLELLEDEFYCLNERLQELNSKTKITI